MEIYTGNAVSTGVAIAEAVVLGTEDYRIPQTSIEAAKLNDELALLDQSIAAAIDDVGQQREHVTRSLGHDAGAIFDWHVGVLREPKLKRDIEALIRKHLWSAAYAASTVMRDRQRRFMQLSDPILVERIRDVQDIERRLLRHILGERREDLAHLTAPVILIAHDLSPTQTAQLGDSRVVGVALDVGGPTSHTAILLRSLGRPAVIGLKDVSTRIGGGETVIVDAVNQLVIARPDENTLKEYRVQQQHYVELTDELSGLRTLSAVTQDGTHVALMGNIEFPRESAICLEKGADGVGLYRTEFLYLRGEGAPDEEEQYAAYREAIQAVQGRPVTIRTFDLGADKYTQERSFEPEANPMLGLRSIRYSLQNLPMFKVQLRAILRASVTGAPGTVRLMFPLIVSLMEFRQAKMILNDVMEDLEEEGIAFSRDIQVGIMVETPAAVGQCREFAREVAFMSIGTNDLVQYMLAVDRGNERVARLYSTSHPAVLRVIRHVIRTCARAGVDCSLCGEMAGQPLYTLLLLGLGLRNFSMAPANVPEVKKLILRASIPDAQRIARRALMLETERQVTNFLREETRKLLPEDPI